MALICVAETYVSGAGMPSNSTRMPPSDVATVFEDVRVKLNALAGPGLMPKILTISPGATAPGMPLAAFTTPLKASDLGSTKNDGLVTNRVIGITMEAAFDAETVIVPLNVPGDRADAFTVTVRIAGVVAEFDCTASQFPPVNVCTKILNGRFVALLWTLRICCELEFADTLNGRAVGSTVNPTVVPVTVRVTGSVRVLLPVAVMVIEPW